MRIFIVGDYVSGTGPANVTKALIDALPTDTLYLKYMNKVLRLCELYMKIPKSDICVISGHSRQNLHTIRIAHKHNKKVVFLMHGCVEHENDINGVPDEEMTSVERSVLKGSDLILAVSEQFEMWLKEHYPEHKDKISHLINGIDWDIYELVQGDRSVGKGTKEEPYKLISIGGGMPRKRIKRICEAIELLKMRDLYCKLTVAGDKGLDSEIIDGYDFVVNKGLLPREKVMEQLREAQLFIQNSNFETFGLAPFEALLCGCDLLMSKAVGAISVFDKSVISSCDIISDCEDAKEIADKIEYILANSNHDRLFGGIYQQATGYEARARELIDICRKTCKKE